MTLPHPGSEFLKMRVFSPVIYRPLLPFLYDIDEARVLQIGFVIRRNVDRTARDLGGLDGENSGAAEGVLGG